MLAYRGDGTSISVFASYPEKAGSRGRMTLHWWQAGEDNRIGATGLAVTNVASLSSAFEDWHAHSGIEETVAKDTNTMLRVVVVTFDGGLFKPVLKGIEGMMNVGGGLLTLWTNLPCPKQFAFVDETLLAWDATKLRRHKGPTYEHAAFSRCVPVTAGRHTVGGTYSTSVWRDPEKRESRRPYRVTVDVPKASTVTVILYIDSIGTIGFGARSVSGPGF
jgi:hypothetical protein